MSVPAMNAEELSWKKLLYTYYPPFRIPFGGYKGSGFLGRWLHVVFWNFSAQVRTSGIAEDNIQFFTLSLVLVCRDTSFIVVLVSATMKGVCKMFEEPVQNMQFENFV